MKKIMIDWKLAVKVAVVAAACVALQGRAEFRALTPEKRKDYTRELDFFRSGLKEYFYNNGAGHYRLDVSDAAVTMAFYPGAACEPARTFHLA